MSKQSSKKRPKKHISLFTLRESQYVEQVMQGKSLPAICSSLNVGKATVYFYINAIQQKFERVRETIRDETG